MQAQAHLLAGFGGLAVCILFVLIGAGILFEPDGADGQCTAYYDGFQYHECNSTLLDTVEGSSGALSAANESSSSWVG